MASYNQSTVKVSHSVLKRYRRIRNQKCPNSDRTYPKSDQGFRNRTKLCSKQDGGVQNWAEGSRFRGKFQNSFIDLCQIGGNVQNRANLSNSTVITYRPWWYDVICLSWHKIEAYLSCFMLSVCFLSFEDFLFMSIFLLRKQEENLFLCESRILHVFYCFSGRLRLNNFHFCVQLLIKFVHE